MAFRHGEGDVLEATDMRYLLEVTVLGLHPHTPRGY